MAVNLPLECCERVIVKTGNVINNNDVLMRPGKNAADELWEGLKTVFTIGEKFVYNESELIVRTHQALPADGEDPQDQLTTMKIFVNSDSKELLQISIAKCLKFMEIPHLSILILAYHPSGPVDLELLKTLWSVLQDCVDKKEVDLIGVADVDTEVFFELYNWARVKPSIVQISLAGCCVVPPPLQEFTRANDIQLLTHSDPSEMLPKEKLQLLLPTFPIEEVYVAKLQAHIKCRGVLASKSYLLCVHR